MPLLSQRFCWWYWESCESITHTHHFTICVCVCEDPTTSPGLSPLLLSGYQVHLVKEHDRKFSMGRVLFAALDVLVSFCIIAPCIHYPRRSINYQVPSTSGPLPTIHHQLCITIYPLCVIHYQLYTTDYSLPIIQFWLSITNDPRPISTTTYPLPLSATYDVKSMRYVNLSQWCTSTRATSPGNGCVFI